MLQADMSAKKYRRTRKNVSQQHALLYFFGCTYYEFAPVQFMFLKQVPSGASRASKIRKYGISISNILKL